MMEDIKLVGISIENIPGYWLLFLSTCKQSLSEMSEPFEKTENGIFSHFSQFYFRCLPSSTKVLGHTVWIS